VNYNFHPAAEIEHLEFVVYLESKRPGLGAVYLAEFERALSRACEFPKSYRIEMEPDIRRMSLKRFPFTIYYREKHRVIQVLAVAHHRRYPKYWLGRRNSV
jgi:toxin ParE1/3/4